MLLRKSLATDVVREQAMGDEAAAAIGPSQVVRLWKGQAPGAQGETEADIPVVDVYLPAKNPTRTGVLICPGGGYRCLSLELEGSNVAKWLNERGLAAFVVHYRVQPYGAPAPLLDGARAMRVVRSRAAEFQISPERLGVWGFSAGGHVASMLMTTFNSRSAGGEVDAVDRISDRPDFGVLAYPVISMDRAIAHPGSHRILLGTYPTRELEERYSNERHVKSYSPPAFVFAISDDPVVPVANSVRFYQAYVDRKLPMEMHLFEHGSHGVGLARELPRLKQWPRILASWMRLNGWMAGADAESESQR